MNTKLEEELKEAISAKESLENTIKNEDESITDLEDQIKKTLEEISTQKAKLNEQKRQSSTVEKIFDRKTPFLTKYILGQEKLIEKQNEVNDLKINVFSQLLDH